LPGDLSKLIAAVLAGGLGTRLRSIVADRPKVLAEVSGSPFLQYLFDQIVHWGIEDIVVCTGYLGDLVQQQFGRNYKTAKLRYSQELSPLGTAGALRFAFLHFSSDTVLVLNGDSFCSVNMKEFLRWHYSRKSDTTLLLVENADTARYGRVKTDFDGHITRFEEKGESSGPGLINAGIYLIQRAMLKRIPERAVSLERDVFPSLIGGSFYAYQTHGPFLDIGTPESYAKAEGFFATWTLS
jgi:D-glycero-alpha-D-manno-heptose 1-phosphate guanylyltransferase